MAPLIPQIEYGPDQISCYTGPGYARWLKLLQVRVMYKLYSRDSIHDLLSPCMRPMHEAHACVLA